MDNNKIKKLILSGWLFLLVGAAVCILLACSTPEAQRMPEPSGYGITPDGCKDAKGRGHDC